ncbi:PilN domain-containing protein [Loktanella agnita]|uniref:PilN domain-containing protein n=1 Tax=Loktanella agnita TaxID=287097 RepID=UPI00398807B6
MTKSSDASATTSATQRSVNTLTKLRNLASAALAALDAAAQFKPKAPPPQIVINDDGFAVALDDEMTQFSDRSALAAQLAALPERRLDIVFAGRSALDLNFTVPNGPFRDVEAMIDSELAFRSPFQRDQCRWFWVAHETDNGDWQVQAAIVLNTSIDWVLDAFSAHKKQVSTARRHAADGSPRLTVHPDWATGKASHTDLSKPAHIWRTIPRVLRLPVISFMLLAVSTLVCVVAQSVRYNDAENRAVAANATISRLAASQAATRALQDTRMAGNAKLALLGNLAVLLPDGVWLEQIAIEDDRLTITGYGPSAAEVTRLLATLDGLAEIEFGSPVTRDNTQNLERFRINATLTGALS